MISIYLWLYLIAACKYITCKYITITCKCKAASGWSRWPLFTISKQLMHATSCSITTRCSAAWNTGARVKAQLRRSARAGLRHRQHRAMRGSCWQLLAPTADQTQPRWGTQCCPTYQPEPVQSSTSHLLLRLFTSTQRAHVFGKEPHDLAQGPSDHLTWLQNLPGAPLQFKQGGTRPEEPVCWLLHLQGIASKERELTPFLVCSLKPTSFVMKSKATPLHSQGVTR